MRRLRGMFSWAVAGPLVAYALAILLAVAFAEAWVARQEAIDTRNRTAIAAARRIDQLQGEINFLQDRLRNTAVRDAHERGRLEDAIRALATQIRQQGGTPVTDGQPQPEPSPARPAVSPAASPRPTSTPSRTPQPEPSPSPSPTCLRAPLLHRHICIQ